MRAQRRRNLETVLGLYGACWAHTAGVVRLLRNSTTQLAKFAYAGLMLEASTINDMSRRDRQRLMKFICSFAWADLQIRPEERQFVAHIVTRLELDDAERAEVEQWLKVPPSPEAIDPMQIPVEQRELFLDSIEGVIVSDGEVSVEERENLALLKDLLQAPN
jgi:hypothetical protein